MRMVLSTLVVCALAWGTQLHAFAAESSAEPSPSEVFDRGRVAFDRGEYARAIELLRPMLYPEIRMDEESQVVRSHRMLGVAHLFENQPAEARQEFLRLLELRPDYRFDPLLDPPRVVDFFNAILRDQEAQVASLDRRRKEAQAAEANRVRPRPVQFIERNYERHSLSVALIPFGAGQFQNGDDHKGWIFLGAESALAGVSLAAFTTNFLLYGTSYKLPCKKTPSLVGGASGQCPPEDVDRTSEERSSLLLNVQLVSGGLFFAAAAWGVVDALIHYRPSVQLGGPKFAPGTTGVTTSAREGFDVSMFPTFVGGSPGTGLSMRF